MPIAQDNTLGSLGTILGAVPGLTEAINGKTTNTNTSNSGISGQGLSALLSQLLSGTQGLASVAGGQNTAGLYNSTVQTQQVNDLLTRTAGEVQAKGPTTTSSTSQVQPTVNLGQTLLTGLGGLVGTHLATKGINGLGSTLSSALGLDGAGGSAAGNAAVGTALSGAPEFTTAGSAVAPGAASLGGLGTTGAAGGVDAAASSATAAGLSSAADGGLGAIAGATGTGALDASTAAGIGAATAGLAGATTAATAGGLAAGGATLAGIGGGIAGDVAASTAGIAAASGVGAGAAGAAAAGGGLLADAAPIAAALAWVICTELETQHVMSKEVYDTAAPDFISRTKLKPSAVRGYHYWAVPYTRLIRKNTIVGRIAKNLITPLAIGRAKHIAGEWNLLGAFTFRVLEPICSFLGNTVARKGVNWKQLYSGGK